MSALILQRMLIEFVLDLIYFPLWWYTGGAKRALVFCWHLVLSTNSYLAPGLWLRNIFVPMFGQSDWQGRIMSFFMRGANVIFRTFALLIWIVIVIGLFLLWCAIPVFVLTMLYNSLV